ncbi:MAG: translation initiation factor IF-3 [Candidatus Omnitrophota bacterium]|nr:translation initiation factor IF-3 [Candidatus Omnitrophota bacterium]MBU1894736.1 translation initiation factor IF-3 [Candidatus Omnitrophota bacterium]
MDKNARNSRFQETVRVNTRIRVPKVRLVDDEGNQLGVVEIEDAIRIAQEKGLDLVEVAATSSPPVCRIMDYSKFKYEQKKKQKLAKKKQHVTHIKEVRFKPKIEEHDYQVKIKHIRDFLVHKDKVRISLRFRGRENAHKEFGLELLNRITQELSAIGEPESQPKTMGKTMMVTLVPKA